MKRIVSLIVSLCLFQHFLLAQQEHFIDSLQSNLKTSKQDTNRLNILEQLADNAPDGVWEKHNEEMGLLSETLMKSNVPAIRLKAKKHAAAYFGNMGYQFGQKYDYKSALLNFEKAAKIQEEINDKINLIATLSSIGAIYERQKDNDQALKYYHQALGIQRQTGDSTYLVVLYNNIAVISSDKDSALTYCIGALKVAEATKNTANLSALYGNLGDNMLGRKQYAVALNYYLKGLKVGQQAGDNLGTAHNLEGIGRVNFEKGVLSEALEFAKQSLSIAEKEKSPKYVISSAQLLKKIYEKQGKLGDAYQFYKIEIRNRDSLLSKENQKAVIRHQYKYEYDLKEAISKAEQEKKDAIAQKELQKQKLVRNGFMGGFAVVLLFAGVFFTQRNKIKKGKKRSDELLLNILPSEVAEELKAKGSADAKQFEEVTVMFTDFKGFTQISEKLSPTELVNEIHTCFKAFDRIITKHNIEKIKTIGDSYMCAGGLPVANKTHAEDVVKAALEIQQFMYEHLLQRKKENKEVFEIRIGIHTGTVVAGIVGVKKFAYDIWGDTVNIASRMESSGEAGKINISRSTYELVKDKFSCTHRGKIQAKNKGEIDMYFAEPI